MSYFSLATYLISGSICLMSAVMLLSVKGLPCDDKCPFMTVKRLLACAAFSDVLVDAIVLLCICRGVDFFVLDNFFILVIYYFQLSVITFALLGLVRSRFIDTHKVYKSLLPACAIVVAYVIAYMVAFNGEVSWNNYLLFVEMRAARIISYVMFAAIAFAFVMSLNTLFRATANYNLKVRNFFSGKSVVTAGKIGYFVYAYIGYFFLAAVDSVVSSEVADSVLMIVNTVIFYVCTIVLINLQRVYQSVSPIDYQREGTDAQRIGVEEAALRPSAVPGIESVVSEWVARDEKPYLEDGITLADVAVQMNINPRLLSGFINNIYHVNFNAWINQLRIEEVKRLIESDRRMPLSKIAFATGFTDPASMTKVFKNIMGVAPSVYREQLP